MTQKKDDLGRKTTLLFRHAYSGRAALAVGGNVWLLLRMLGHRLVETSAHSMFPFALSDHFQSRSGSLGYMDRGRLRADD